MTQDTAYQLALDRLQALAEERRELEAFVDTYRKLTGVRVKLPEPASSASDPTSATAPPQRLVDAAMAVLSKKGEPMKLGAIYDALIAQGFVISGKVPRNNLGAKLSADKRLRTYQGLGWWFANEPLPVGFFPEPPPRRLDSHQNDEGPAADAARPSYSNGAASAN